MRTVFADALYWVAIANPRDHWRDRALAVSQSLPRLRIVTTEEVLTEALNALGGAGSYTRSRAIAAVRRILADPGIEVVPQTSESFAAGLALYEQRPDKGYSLTDCISMATMRARGITEVLTHDHHFEQEGFVILIR
jgi:predicted nucleic acid-binding protein